MANPYNSNPFFLRPDLYVLNANGTAFVRCDPLLCQGISLDPLQRLQKLAHPQDFGVPEVERTGRSVNYGGIIDYNTPYGPNFLNNAAELQPQVYPMGFCPHTVLYERGCG